MKYLKTYEQLKEIYPSSKSKYLIVTDDEKWYMRGEYYHRNDESDGGYIILSPVDKLEEIDSDYLVDDENAYNWYLSSRQVVNDMVFHEYNLEREAIPDYMFDRENMIDEILYKAVRDARYRANVTENSDKPKYSDIELSKMSDEEMKKVFIKEIINDPDYSRGEAESDGFVYIKELPLKVVEFQLGAIRKSDEYVNL